MTLTQRPAPRVHDDRLLEAAALLVLMDAADAAVGGREGRLRITRWAQTAPSVTGPLASDPTSSLDERAYKRIRPMLARVRPARLERSLRELRRLATLGIGVRTCRQQPPAPVLGGYPQPVTYTRGTLGTVDDAVIALLGDPDATQTDRHTATTVAHDLTEQGLTVLTGWRSRIDRMAAWAALGAGGRPILFADRGLEHVTTQDPLVGAVITVGGLVASAAPPGAQHWPEWWMDALAWAHGLIPTSGTDYGLAHLAARASLMRGRGIGPHHIAVPGHLEHTDGWLGRLVGCVGDAFHADWLDPTDPAWAARLRYWARTAHGWRTPDVQQHRHDLDAEPERWPA